MKMNEFMKCKGQFIAVEFTSTKAPRADFKNRVLTKNVRMVARAGIDFANLSVVKDGIADGSRGPIQTLPWGQWDQFPYTISHKGEMYYRLYPVANNIPKVTYFVDGNEVDKGSWMAYLTPSDQRAMVDGQVPQCITVKAANCKFPE